MPRNPRFNVVWTLVREHDEIVRFNLSDLLEEITGPADAESILRSARRQTAATRQASSGNNGTTSCEGTLSAQANARHDWPSGRQGTLSAQASSGTDGTSGRQMTLSGKFHTRLNGPAPSSRHSGRSDVISWPFIRGMRRLGIDRWCRHSDDAVRRNRNGSADRKRGSARAARDAQQSRHD
jgi:hypothetical protein